MQIIGLHPDPIKERSINAMPLLQNPRHETFAQARAAGALLEDAYEAAGFVPGLNHASRLARTPEVAMRIGELRAHARFPDPAAPSVLIGALLQMAEHGRGKTVEWAKEARMALMDAARLRAEWSRERQADLQAIIAGAAADDGDESQ